MLATLGHLLNADGRYLTYLGDNVPAQAGAAVAKPLDDLANQLRNQAVRWRELLARVNDLDVTIPARSDRPELPHATNLLLVQALHHGNDHRTEICTILTTNGFEGPDLDVWSYWIEKHPVEDQAQG